MSNMGELADVVLALDRFQTNHPDAKRCPEHGKLTAHPSGKALVCGLCKTFVSVDAELVQEAFTVR